MILTAGKYEDVKREGVKRADVKRGPERPQLFVPTVTGARQRLCDWYWRELKEGGFLHEYLRREKARTPALIRNVARMMHGFQQNPRSDIRRLAAIPARLYHRWKEEDAHFFDDDANLRSLRRDNPDLPVYVAPRALARHNFRKRYAAA